MLACCTATFFFSSVRVLATTTYLPACTRAPFHPSVLPLDH